jgi:hypothetical protein
MKMMSKILICAAIVSLSLSNQSCPVEAAAEKDEVEPTSSKGASLSIINVPVKQELENCPVDQSFLGRIKEFSKKFGSTTQAGQRRQRTLRNRRRRKRRQRITNRIQRRQTVSGASWGIETKSVNLKSGELCNIRKNSHNCFYIVRGFLVAMVDVKICIEEFLYEVELKSIGN